MNLAVLGINFKTAPLELREQFSLTPARVPDAVRHVAGAIPQSQALMLSTCNRTELYVGVKDLELKKDSLLAALSDSTGVRLNTDAADHFYIHRDIAAVEHLMAVSSSLESMVVGETEILGQVKQAYALATEAQPDAKQLHPLFQSAIRAAKRVHTETDICKGRVSVSSIAVEFAKKVFDHLSAKTVMIIGAGETGELTLKSLVEKGVEKVFVRLYTRTRTRLVRPSERCTPLRTFSSASPSMRPRTLTR